MRLTVENISKNYGKKSALSEVNLHMDNGIYALLGPNGAGKTSLLNIITGIISPDTGIVRFNGCDINKNRDDFLTSLGYMPQAITFYPNFSILEMITYIGVLKGLNKKAAKEEGEKMLKQVNLYNERHKKVKACSGGMKQRLGIAQCLMNSPSVIIFDEPTAGLDPQERIRFRNAISRLSKDKTVIISTHIVSDIDEIADKIILLKNGKILTVSEPTFLCHRLDGMLWQVSVTDVEAIRITEDYDVHEVRRKDGKCVLTICYEKKPFHGAEPVAATLEDAYLYFFKEEGDNAFKL